MSNKTKVIRRTLLALLLLFVLFCRFIPAWGEWYAVSLYPYISYGLSSFSSLFPFSLGDCFIIGGITGMTAYFVYALCRKNGRKRRLLRWLESGVWIYVWFYLAWGLNYFRMPFYERTNIPRAEYSPENFEFFLSGYVTGLNESYMALKGRDSSVLYKPSVDFLERTEGVHIEDKIFSGYRVIAPEFGLVRLRLGEVFPAKNMLSSYGMSLVGVTGYMGPFFSEYHLNKGLLTVEYPFTYAHELAHRLGIAGESEANFYAYLVCTADDTPEIRFSGYFSLLGYVAGNARRLMDEVQYKEFYDSINPEIIALYKYHLNYWRSKYSPWIGKIQNSLYDFYLKGNQVSSGVKNYSEVIGLLMSWKQYNDIQTLPGHSLPEN